MCARRLYLSDPHSAVINDVVVPLIERGSRVVDLGCGDASLLARLRDERDCNVLGIERDEEAFIHSIQQGVPIIKADLNQGLTELPPHSFDYAVLSQTLQQISRPLELLHAIFRVAHRAVVVVPNFAHWRIRLHLLTSGRAPVTDHLPYEWFESPNVHFLSMLDFRELAQRGDLRIVSELPIIGSRAVDKARFANLRAQNALYILERTPDTTWGTAADDESSPASGQSSVTAGSRG